MRGFSSIGGKLRWLGIISSSSAVGVASLALLFFQLHYERDNMLRRLDAVADLIAFHSAAAVDFDDADAATATLAWLKTRPSVEFAGIVVNNRLFAQYGNMRMPPSEREEILRTKSGHRFTKQNLTVFRPISFRGRFLGTFFIRADLREIDLTWRRFAGITAAVTIPALLIAILVSQLLQRSISRPILNLASLAVAVSQQKDYSVRAQVMPSAAEIEQLVRTFNQMLTDIQRQHLELDRAQTTLEQRVADRTRQLEERTKQLESQERELAVTNKELESFSYSVSHDLRAPLRALDGFSRALQSEYKDRPLDERGMHFLDRVRSGTQKMSTLIDDLLHLSRVTRAPLERRMVDITSVAEGVAAELASRNPDRQVLCVIEPGLRASADPHLLTIAFENLLGNAWKFSGHREDAHIEVGQASNGGEPIYFVRDNGAGFSMAYSDKLFGAFQRLHGEAEFEGTGIGLATVKRIITRHGGTVWASAAEGQGATFYFTLGGKS
jgi:signal transduction histidine kinase